jgi:hypothetical protein
MIQGLQNSKNVAVLGNGAIFLSALIFNTMGLSASMVGGNILCWALGSPVLQ